MDFDYEKRVFEVRDLTEVKWKARKNHIVPDYSSILVKNFSNRTSHKVLYPRELQEILNLKTALCPSCGVPCAAKHMLADHNLYVPDNEFLLKKCSDMSRDSHIEGLNRSQTLTRIASYLTPFILCIKKRLNK